MVKTLQTRKTLRSRVYTCLGDYSLLGSNVPGDVLSANLAVSPPATKGITSTKVEWASSSSEDPPGRSDGSNFNPPPPPAEPSTVRRTFRPISASFLLHTTLLLPALCVGGQRPIAAQPGVRTATRRRAPFGTLRLFQGSFQINATTFFYYNSSHRSKSVGAYHLRC